MTTRAGVVASVAALAIVLAIASVAAQPDDAAAPAPADPDREASLAAWTAVYRVLVHPRCRNCHPDGDAPLQGDAGVRHAQNISRRSVANGLPCASCHRSTNSRRRHGPPGAPGWKLPPGEHPMVFEGRSSAALCAQIKDPEQNGHLELAGLIHHVDEPLVRWAWEPGPGRSVPPITHAEFATAMRRWVDTGAACP
jgi:hypothetical protein